MIFIYPGTISTFTGDREIALRAGYVEVEESTYHDLVDTKKKWENGEIVEDPTYPQRKLDSEKLRAKEEKQELIDELKKQLSALDYHTLKHVDGAMTDEEYEPIKQQKIAYRAKINELEAQMLDE